MSHYQSLGRTPKVILIASGGQWEQDASKIAADIGVSWITFASGDDVLALEAGDYNDSCVLVDSRHPNVDWTALYDGMLEKLIEIPVVVSVPEANWHESIKSVTECANFVVSQPMDKEQMIEMIDCAHQNESFVRHRYAVERSYRRLVMLDERERSILTLAVEGSPNKQIARKLGYHIKTIERIRNVAYDKLRVRSTAEMTRLMTLAELYQFVRPTKYPVQTHAGVPRTK